MSSRNVYPTRTFSQLRPSIRQVATTAGQLGFVRMYERYHGILTGNIAEEASKHWMTAMDRVDLAYGKCTCGDPEVAKQCPSYDEHSLVAEFIDAMEDAGFRAANSGIRLNKDTIEMYTHSIINDFNR